MTFGDRMAAGRVLAALLDEYAHRDDTIVLALPRGGVPVAREIALALQAPGGVLVLNQHAEAEIPGLRRLLEPVVAQERRELARREAAYRRGRPPLDVAGRTVILVDDGIGPGAIQRLARHADRIVCPEQPADFMAVGQYYDDFPQLTDAEVVRLLAPGNPAVD